MQDRAKLTRRRILFAILVFAILATALLAYLLSSRSSSTHLEGPLTIGTRLVAGGSALAKINQTFSFGFNVKNAGVAPITLSGAEASLSDKEVELVELVFINYTYKVVGIINGTAEENGFVTFSVQGYIIQPGEQAEVSVALRSPTSGNHSLTGVTFAYSYMGSSYTFEYQKFFADPDGFTILVQNT